MFLQRMLQVIYGIRVQEYILQTILIVINLLKIASVYFFINNGQCNIAGYFLFCQVVTTLGFDNWLGIFATKKYSIPVMLIFSFNHPVFEKNIPFQ